MPTYGGNTGSAWSSDGAMPLIHGSQGCSTYMRFQFCRHFREPVNVSSTSMSEGTVVYGGEANLLKALETIWKEYKPEIIGVTSSCLTETIGDDMGLIIQKFQQVNILMKNYLQLFQYHSKLLLVPMLRVMIRLLNHFSKIWYVLQSLMEKLTLSLELYHLQISEK